MRIDFDKAFNRDKKEYDILPVSFRPSCWSRQGVHVVGLAGQQAAGAAVSRKF